MLEKDAKERAKDFTDNKERQVAYECGFLDGADFVRRENAELKEKLAGLKTGKDMNVPIKWHKVSEQIPTEEKSYLVKLTDGTVDVMTIALDGNLEPYLLVPDFDFYKDVEKWCEIPEEE